MSTEKIWEEPETYGEDLVVDVSEDSSGDEASSGVFSLIGKSGVTLKNTKLVLLKGSGNDEGNVFLGLCIKEDVTEEVK